MRHWCKSIALPPNGPRRAAKTARGRERAPRIDEQNRRPAADQGQTRSARRRRRPMQYGRRGRPGYRRRAARQDRAKVGIVDRNPPQGPASARKAAAASLDPPPMPAATGRFFSQMEGGAGAYPGMIGEQPRGAQHQIVGARPRGRLLHAQLTSSDSALAGSRRQAVADIGKGDEAVDQMIAIRSPPDQVEIKIYFCRSKDRDRHRQLSRRRLSSWLADRCRAWPRSA